MTESGRVIGLGAAYVDAKIQSLKLHLPSQRDQLPAFLDNHPEADLSPGGSIPNILTSLINLSYNPNVKLLSCVGDDARGKFYAEHTDRRLGEPKVSLRNPTGVWVGIYNHHGLFEELDFYGAARDITISKEELQASRNDVFITDIDVCRDPQAVDPVKQALDATEDNGLFVLSLSGADPNENLYQILSFTDRQPDVVFGNISELSHITHQTDIDVAVRTALPSTKLLVITQAERGGIIRFENNVFSVAAKYIPIEKVIDTTGAGDTYMGTMLALLLRKRSTDWNERDIVGTARIASYASTLVIQSTGTRLTTDMARLVQACMTQNAI